MYTTRGKGKRVWETVLLFAWQEEGWEEEEQLKDGEEWKKAYAWLFGWGVGWGCGEGGDSYVHV